MCLIVHKSEVPQLLTEDRIVYKIVEFDTAEPCVCHAKYRTYKYTFGKLNKTILKHNDLHKYTAVCDMESCYTIMAKYKPYLNGIDKKTNITPSDCISELTKSGEFIEYGQGFHSFVTMDNIRL